MRIAVVVAMARGGVIGRAGGLPWHLPADLRYFKSITMGKPIIMGRATHESIGRALPGRQNIVLTRRAGYAAAGCTVVNSPGAAIEAADGAEEAMVIGGAEVYAAFLPLADRLYLTAIDADIPGDTHFPPYDAGAWREVSREIHPADARNPYPYSFVAFDRVATAAD